MKSVPPILSLLITLSNVLPAQKDLIHLLDPPIVSTVLLATSSTTPHKPANSAPLALFPTIVPLNVLLALLALTPSLALTTVSSAQLDIT